MIQCKRHLSGAALLICTALPGGAHAGTAVPAPVTLKTTTGKTVQPLQHTGKYGVVFLFIQHGCPISNATSPYYNKLCREFTPKGFKFYYVFVEHVSAKQAEQHAKAYQYACPALLDPQQKLVHLAKATITPEAAIFSPQGTRLYMGRVNNLFAALGIQRPHITSSDLRNALHDIASRLPVAHPVTTAVGCYIPLPLTGR